MGVEGARENVCRVIDKLYEAKPDFIEGGDWLKEGQSFLRQAKKRGEAANKHIVKIQAGLAEVAKHLSALAEVTGEGAQLSADIKERTIRAFLKFEAADEKLTTARERSVAAIGSQETESMLGYPTIDTMPGKQMEKTREWKEKAEGWSEGFDTLHATANELLPQVQGAIATAEGLPAILGAMNPPQFLESEELGGLADNSFRNGDVCAEIAKGYEKRAERMLQ